MRKVAGTFITFIGDNRKLRILSYVTYYCYLTFVISTVKFKDSLPQNAVNHHKDGLRTWGEGGCRGDPKDFTPV